MKKEIGSNFWIEKKYNGDFIDLLPKVIKYPFKDFALLSSGRNAIKFVLKDMKDKTKKVLLPAFTCYSVEQPFLDLNYDVEYFNLNNNLFIDNDNLKNKINEFNPSVILIHRYFGFNTIDDKTIKILNEAKNKGVVIIEDITQCLFSSFDDFLPDYFIGSFRKWLGIPDGAIALKSNDNFLVKPINSNKKLEELKVKAMFDKYNYIINDIGDKKVFLNELEEAEEYLHNSINVCRMSNTSSYLINFTNYEELIKKRKENYKFLYENLKSINFLMTIFKYDDNIVPLYYTCYIDKKLRYNFRKYMSSHNVYLPIIWPYFDHNTNIDSKNIDIYDNIISIPCDQRYDLDDMECIVNLIKEFERLI